MRVVILSHPFQVVRKDDKWGGGGCIKEEAKRKFVTKW